LNPAELSGSVAARDRPRRVGFALVAAVAVTATSTAGRLISRVPVRDWYPSLVKPSFNPPNWAFPVAWTLLFILMGVAFWRVLTAPSGTPWRAPGMTLFVVQLVVNVGWSTAFFGARSPLLGMLVILPFWALICANAVLFWKVDRVAAWLLVPYLGWVAFASVLNAAILRMN
jgi:tryptophan-rich sensory protein